MILFSFNSGMPTWSLPGWLVGSNLAQRAVVKARALRGVGPLAPVDLSCVQPGVYCHFPRPFNSSLASEMPYNRRRSAPRRRRWKRKGRRRMIGASCSAPFEKKSHESVFTDEAISTTVAVLDGLGGQSLNLIAQGTTDSTRIGRSICVHDIMVDGRVELPASTATSNSENLVKFHLVLDKQCNGADAAVADVVTVAAAGMHSYRNLANAKRFQILATKVVRLQATIYGNGTTNKGGPVAVPIKIYKKGEWPISFNSTAGAITEVESNNLFLMAVCATSAGPPTFTARFRLRYTG